MKLGLIEQRKAEVIGKTGSYADIVPDYPVKQLLRVANNDVDIEFRRAEKLFAAKGKELVRERG